MHLVLERTRTACSQDNAEEQENTSSPSSPGVLYCLTGARDPCLPSWLRVGIHEVAQ